MTLSHDVSTIYIVLVLLLLIIIIMRPVLNVEKTKCMDTPTLAPLLALLHSPSSSSCGFRLPNWSIPLFPSPSLPLSPLSPLPSPLALGLLNTARGPGCAVNPHCEVRGGVPAENEFCAFLP